MERDRELPHPGCAALLFQAMICSSLLRTSRWLARSMKNLHSSSPKTFKCSIFPCSLDGGVPVWSGWNGGLRARSSMKRLAHSHSCSFSVKATAARFPSRNWLSDRVFPICLLFQGCIFQCFWVSVRRFVPFFLVPAGRSEQEWFFLSCLFSSPVPNPP